MLVEGAPLRPQAVTLLLSLLSSHLPPLISPMSLSSLSISHMDLSLTPLQAGLGDTVTAVCFAPDGT